MTGAKWGDSTRLYGDVTRLYGADGVNPGGGVQWIFLVDWDNDGTFAYNEAAYVVDLETNRGQRYLVQPSGDGFETIRPGEGTITLEDLNSRFDPDNASGPLYGKIMPGRKYKLMIKNIALDITYNVMAGIIYNIPPISEIDQIQFSLRDSMQLLDRRISLPLLYRKSITGAMSSLLGAAHFPTAWLGTFDTDPQQITAFAPDDINALDTLIDLGAACLGQVFSDNQGHLRFYWRGHPDDGIPNPPFEIDQADCLKAIRRSLPWENLRNWIDITANQKAKTAEDIIWQNASVISVPANGSTQITVTFGDAIDLNIYSVTANSTDDGKGENRSSYIATGLDVHIRSAILTLNNSFGSTVYVTEIVILGKPIIDVTLRTTAKDATSITAYGEMVYSLDNTWLQDYTHAKAFAAMILAMLKDPKRTIEVQLEQRPDLQYNFDLMDQVLFTSAKLGINETLYVGRIEHRWLNPTGQAVATTLVIKPRLTNSDAIANDPEAPDIPYIPPWDGGINPPPGDTCLTDPAAPANGPFTVSGHLPVNLVSNGQTWVTFGGNGAMRPGNFQHPSYLTILGDWQTYNSSTGQWVGDRDTSWWHVSIDSIDGVCSTPYDNGSGTRTIVFKPGVARSANPIICKVDAGGGGAGAYSKGPVLESKIAYPVWGSYSQEFDQSDLVAGGTLCWLETNGGPWTGKAGGIISSDQYSLTLDVIGTLGWYHFYGTPHWEYRDLGTSGGGSAVNMLQVDQTDAQHGRMYFKRYSGTQNIHVGGMSFDYPPTFTGSIGYTWGRGQITTGLHRWTIRGLSLWNVCAQ